MKEMRVLECTLTQEDLDIIARDLAATQIRLREVEAEKSRTMSHYSDRIKHLRGHLDEQSLRHHSQRTMRPVECEIQREEHKLAIRVIRLDTGEIIEERAMTPEERQVGLPGVA